MLLRVTKRFRAQLAEVYAWRTDFRESDPQLSRARLRTRRALRRDGAEVEMEETGVMAFPFTARFLVRLSQPDAWVADGRSNVGRTHNTYRLSEVPEGTELVVTFDLQLTGAYRMFTPFVRGYVLRRLSREWADYVRAMEAGG